MLTLSDINSLTNSKDGDIYSDLFKDVNGFRPRGHTFRNLKQFNQDFDWLAKRLEEKIQEDNAQQAKNWDRFLSRVFETRDVVVQTTTEDALRIIADAEGIDADELRFYGWESLEYALNLKFGAIKQFLSEVSH